MVERRIGRFAEGAVGVRVPQEIRGIDDRTYPIANCIHASQNAKRGRRNRAGATTHTQGGEGEGGDPQGARASRKYHNTSQAENMQAAFTARYNHQRRAHGGAKLQIEMETQHLFTKSKGYSLSQFQHLCSRTRSNLKDGRWVGGIFCPYHHFQT